MTQRTVLFAALATLTACSDYSVSGGGRGYTDASDGAMSGEGPDGQTGEAGALTAGAWDDNANYDLFTDFFDTTAPNLEGAPTLTQQERDAAYERAQQATDGRQRLDIAVVLDVTGSMYDEHAWLAAEFSALAERIDATYPDADSRWALVAYGDQGDAFVTEVHDFTPNAGRFNTSLTNQEMASGGDYPEAAAPALEDTMKLDWRRRNTARLVFWVADAPHHASAESQLTQALRKAADDDIHIYPIAASGTDELTELTMRASAQLTLGRYLFLTDDSGIGGTHAEPTVPCYFVTKLDDAITRMVDVEMTGTYREPSSDELIRTGGDPTDGRCTLADESVVVAF